MTWQCAKEEEEDVAMVLIGEKKNYFWLEDKELQDWLVDVHNSLFDFWNKARGPHQKCTKRQIRYLGPLGVKYVLVMGIPFISSLQREKSLTKWIALHCTLLSIQQECRNLQSGPLMLNIVGW